MFWELLWAKNNFLTYIIVFILLLLIFKSSFKKWSICLLDRLLD